MLCNRRSVSISLLAILGRQLAVLASDANCEMGGTFQFVNRAETSSALDIHNNTFLKKVQVKVGRSLRGPVTVSTQEPFRREQFPKGRVAFEVAMPRKDCRTAVGFVGLPESTSAYLTPDYLPKGYVSMGGAGFLYPSKSAATKGYSQGDRVKVELDWAKGHVYFYVNTEQVGMADWDGSDVAYPALAVFPGELTADISFDTHPLHG